MPLNDWFDRQREEIEVKRRQLRHKIEWIKLRRELEREEEEAVTEWNVTLVSMYDTTEFSLIGSFADVLEHILRVTDPQQVTTVNIHAGALPTMKGTDA